LNLDFDNIEDTWTNDTSDEITIDTIRVGDPILFVVNVERTLLPGDTIRIEPEPIIS